MRPLVRHYRKDDGPNIHLVTSLGRLVENWLQNVRDRPRPERAMHNEAVSLVGQHTVVDTSV